jgi:hypothetical protein
LRSPPIYSVQREENTVLWTVERTSKENSNDIKGGISNEIRWDPRK